MPGEDDVLINFVGNTEELKPIENVLDSIITKGDEVGEAWKKTSAAIAASNAANAKGLKAIEDMGAAQLKASTATNKLLEDLTAKISKLGTSYEAVTVKEKELGQEVEKTNKAGIDGTTKFTKSIENLATATKSMDKAVIGGAYKEYLKQVQAQLGLTNKELVSFITNARSAAREAIITAQTDEEIDQLTLSIEAMNDQLQLLAIAEDSAGNKSDSLRARIKLIKEELIAMADAGLEGTPAFQQLRQNAAELENQVGDLNKTIKNLGSDTKNIDGVISLVGGLAGGFAVAQGAAALFGDESEDVQKALLKVNAAMSILQGLQQFQNTLQSKSAGILLLQRLGLLGATEATITNTIATEANVVAEGEQAAGAAATAAAQVVQTDATIALAEANVALTETQVAANAAFALSPIGLVVTALVALAGAIYLATRNTKEYAAEQANLNDALQKSTVYLESDLKVMEQIAAKELALAKQRGASATELTSIEGKAGLARLKTIDDARVAAANAYNESLRNDKETIESRQKLYDKIFDLQKQYQEEAAALRVKGVEFDTQRDADAYKSFVSFQAAKVAATIAGTDAERTAQIASLKEIAAQREFSAEFIALTDGEKAQKRAEDEKQIQGLLLSNYQHYLKGRTSLDESYVAIAKANLIKNQVDTIASITAVNDAEIEALKKRRTEALSDPTLNAGERKKIVDETNLAIIEAERQKQLKILDIEKSEINDRLAAAQKGTEAEYNLRLQAITNEQQVALAATELIAGQIAAINEKYEKQRQEASRAFQEQQLQNQISLDNALLDRFGITEKEKLSLTLKRLDEEEQLEISQAENNAAKIQEINARFAKQKIEANKATNATILADNLKIVDVFTEIANRRNEAAINNPALSATSKRIANDQILKDAEFKTDLERSALEKDKLLIDAHVYALRLQEIENEEDANKQKHSDTAIQIFREEQEKKLSIFQTTLAILQTGIDQLDTSGLKTGLTEVLGLYNKIGEAIVAGRVARKAAEAEQDPKKREDLLKAAELEERTAVVSASIGAAQNTINQLFADSAAQRQQELADNLQALDDAKQKELDNKALTEEQKAEIDKKYKEKEKQEKIKAFIADKEAKRSQAVINGLLGVTNALATAPTILAGIVLAALVAASTIIQVAKINSTPVPKFRHGKVDIEGPGTKTSDSIPAMISKGESVITADATSKWKGALEAMNNDKFEQYLINKFNDFVFPHVPEHIQPAAAGQHIDYDKLSTAIAEKIKGIIPASKQIDFTIDQNGIHTIVKEGNSRTEYKNKRYTMTP